MKKIIKNKDILKYSFFFILGVILCGSAGVLASSYILKSSDIEYKENKSVQEAVEELYAMYDNESTGSNQTLPIGDIVVDGYKITIPYTGSYDVIRCVYGTDTNYGSVGTISGNTCYFYGTDSTQKLYYKIVATTNDGKIYENSGSATTIDTVIADLVNLGDYIYLKSANTSYTIESSSTGWSSSQTINSSELTLWRVIKKNDDGTIDIVSDKVSSTKVYFWGKIGYDNFESTMNSIALAYADETVESGRGIYESDLNIIKNIYGSLVAYNLSNKASDYWLGYNYTDWEYDEDDDGTENKWLWYDYYYGKYISTSGTIQDAWLYETRNGTNTSEKQWTMSDEHYLRPVLTIKSTAKIISGTGTSSDNYKLGI